MYFILKQPQFIPNGMCMCVRHCTIFQIWGSDCAPKLSFPFLHCIMHGTCVYENPTSERQDVSKKNGNLHYNNGIPLACNLHRIR